MTHAEPDRPALPAPRGIHRKVTAATIASYASGLGLAAVVQSLQDGSLITALPPVASAVLAPLAPTLLVLAAGYATTGRVDRTDARRLADAAAAEMATIVERRVDTVLDRRLGDQS